MAMLLGALSVACGSVRTGDGGAPRQGDGAVRDVATADDGPPAPADAAPPSGGDGSDGPDGAVAVGGDAPAAGDASADTGPPPRPDAGPLPPGVEAAAFGCPADPALLACYTFDDAANRLLDGSAHGNQGMINSARLTSGVRGSALSFVAGNEFAIVPPSPSLRVEGGGYTFEAWIRPTMSPADSRVDFIAARWTAANTGFLFGTYDSELHINSNGGTGRRSTAKLPLERWSHVAVVVGASNVLLYIQGVAEPPQAALSFTANDEPLTIGNRNPAQSPDSAALTAFRGDIDVLRIYARARSPAEVCADANRTWTGTSCVDRAFAALGPDR
jgi:hypothetical protein